MRAFGARRAQASPSTAAASTDLHRHPAGSVSPVLSTACGASTLGYRTDLAILELEGGQVADRGDHLVIRTPGNPDYWWGNFLHSPARGDAGGGAGR
jgi:hypothetical protein